jgi:hypothetical protein
MSGKSKQNPETVTEVVKRLIAQHGEEAVTKALHKWLDSKPFRVERKEDKPAVE